MTELATGCPKCGGSNLHKKGKAESGRTRWKCTDCGHRTTNPVVSKPVVEFNSKLPKAKRYVITSAQNATPIHKPFFEAIMQYCRHVGAELIVIPFRYKNPTSSWTANNEHDEWWAADLVPHLYDGRFDIGKGLTVLADIKVQPTAVSPLTGLESMTGARSGIIGHPRVELKTIPTPQQSLPKIMSTTGAITVENYTDTKAGKKGEFHHTFGAMVVEVDRDKFHLRHISALQNGSFIDLEVAADKDGVSKAPPAEGLVMGDTHADFVDPAVVAATFTGKDSIVARLNPKRLVWHDLLDFYSCNHHHRGNPFIAVAKHKAGTGSVSGEVARACAFVDKYGAGRENIFVPSNHPDALARWIREADWRSDPENAEFYLETALEMVRGAEMYHGGARTIDPFHYWAQKTIKAKTVYLHRGDSYTIKGIEVGQHFDQGANGARGSIQAFSRIGVRTVGGHSHSPGIREGAHQVGTSTYLDLEYSGGGLSSWLNTHEIIYANGKRTLVNIIKGDWRLP